MKENLSVPRQLPIAAVKMILIERLNTGEAEEQSHQIFSPPVIRYFPCLDNWLRVF